MKKFITILFCLQLTFSAFAAAWTGTVATAFSSGDGTRTKPYLITSADELAYLASFANTNKTNTLGKFFQLNADIDLGNIAWTPIGTLTNPFQGYFEGNNHSISNIKINDLTTTGTMLGLFGLAQGASATAPAVILNTTMASGAIAGYTYVGSIAGRGNYVKIYNCKNTGVLVSASSAEPGGIVGRIGNVSIVEYCTNSAAISGALSGGIVGNAFVSIVATDSSFVRFCGNTGAISGSASVGGVIGGNTGNLTIKECYNSASVTAANTGAGGIIGMGYSLLNIKNCYNTGIVRQSATSYTSTSYVGGILGYPGSGAQGRYFQSISNCYNTGVFYAYNATTPPVKEAIAGRMNDGLAGGAVGTVSNCFFYTTALDVTNANGGSSKTLTEMQDVSFVAGLNQNATVWTKDATVNNGLPILSWQLKAIPQYSWNGAVATAFAGGDGSLANPYLITNADQLAYLASIVNTVKLSTFGKYYSLTADIDLGMYDWTPIGKNDTLSFNGVFEGNNHAIKGIYINNTTSTGQYLGLFGFVKGTSSKSQAVIRNLSIASGAISGYSLVGGIAGRANYTSLTNCSNNATITSSLENVGGLIGKWGSYGVIEYCFNYSKISGNSYVGGIVGNSIVSNVDSLTSYIRYSGNFAAVSGVSYVGGIAGTNSGHLIIKESCNKGLLTASSNAVGGIIGYGYGLLSIQDCYNTGEVKLSSATSTATPLKQMYLGGILGYAGGNVVGKYFQSITNCYSTGKITYIATNVVVEAIAGALYGVDPATGAKDLAGGTGTVSNSFYLGTQAVTNANGGLAMDSIALRNSAFVTTLINNAVTPVWSADAKSTNGGYPVLSWEAVYIKTTSTDVATAREEIKIYTVGKTIVVDLLEKSKANLLIYTINGSLVKSQKITQSKSEIELSQSGVYVVRVIDGLNATTRKVIVL